MTVTPRDRNTFLVSSRTRSEVEHLVDIETMECSCEAALEFKTTDPEHPCAHVEAVLAELGTPIPVTHEPYVFL